MRRLHGGLTMANFNQINNMINTITPTIQMLFILFFSVILLLLFLKYTKTTKKEKYRMSDNPLEQEIERVRKELSQIQTDLDRSLQQYINLQIQKLREELLEVIQSRKDSSPPQQSSSHPVAERLYDTQSSSPIAHCTVMYNQALESTEAQNRFKKEFSITLVDVPNAMECRRNPALEPIFESADNGIFMVVELRDEGKNYYAVFPSFELTVTKSEYDASAISRLFRCHNFDPEAHNKIAEVAEPAFFNPKDGHTWEFRDGDEGTIKFEVLSIIHNNTKK